jgi:hypothetical protein
MYDLIGDVHGHAKELEALLHKLGYQERNGAYRHPERTVIFVGDLVDRGPYQKRVIEIARSMTEAGTAQVIMGNHEYNAIAYFTEGADGTFLRPRNAKNNKQHQAFLDAYENDRSDWNEVINWFKELPLWLDLPDFRAIHACWDEKLIKNIERQYGGNCLTEDLLFQSSNRDTWQFEAIETLLKGKEIPLPDGNFFLDKDGNQRREIRVQWWRNARTYREAYMGPRKDIEQIPDIEIPGEISVKYREAEKPVFIGHYWMDGDPSPLAKNIACLDYSVAKPRGKLVAYRWSPFTQLSADGYVSVSCYK